ncbi:tumor necrosis factor receptor superfamily member 6 [Rhinatrema bivittatum]|uniref:tumor necrosis factor receptor superfamily member 6 n=1 Tax=Rhinatrema bivittatum TaxID=194408 RepID=UPI00112C989D|nr:tumor necrosis factor receptor superfamily member 6 [Rhinatrema bivittatum]
MVALKIPQLAPLFLVIICSIQSTYESHDASVARVSIRQSNLKRKIAKRCDNCLVDCPKGKYKKSDCSNATGEDCCVSCERGKEYMDKPNQLTHCIRCDTCDHGQGLEVLENCTEDQNTKCQCMKDYYCNSSALCSAHCDPCAKCDNGIERECTSTSNTICRREGRTRYIYWIIQLSILFVGIGIGIAIWVYYKEKRKKKRSTMDDTPRCTEDPKAAETELLLPEDIDIEPYLSEIAQKVMNLTDILSFVRKSGMKEPEIETILHNHQNNEGEQKFQFLYKWYQNHGKKGAYRTLISRLKELQLNKVVDDILGIVPVPSNKESVKFSSIQIEDRNPEDEGQISSVEEGI